MRHHARRLLVVGVVFLVLLAGCASDDDDGRRLLAVTADSTDTPAPAVATTEVVAEPVPSPTALIIESEPAPTTASTVTPALEPTPDSQESPTEVPATPAPTTAVAAAPTADAAPAATTVPAPPPSTDSQQVQAANGAEVYTLNCARCHGENGMGSGQSGQLSAGLIGVGSQYSTAGMIAELTSGHPVTFGFADRLSADEIASVVAYVKSVFP